MKRKIDPDQPYVGTYRLGPTNVELYGLSREYGGSFYVWPDDISLPRLKIGFNYDHWWEVVNVLLHESFEYLCAQKCCRFTPCQSYTKASDTYRFSFDHNLFSQISEDQAYFLAKCLPDLATAWKKHKPKTS